MEPPEIPSSGNSENAQPEPQQPAFVEPALPPAAMTTTTTIKPVARSDTQGSEKGPSDYSYYANRLTDAIHNSQKGPPESMSYYPEQMQYMQAQGTPGLRGPPGTYLIHTPQFNNDQTNQYSHKNKLKINFQDLLD